MSEDAKTGFVPLTVSELEKRVEEKFSKIELTLDGKKIMYNDIGKPLWENYLSKGKAIPQYLIEELTKKTIMAGDIEQLDIDLSKQLLYGEAHSYQITLMNNHTYDLI